MATQRAQHEIDGDFKWLLALSRGDFEPGIRGRLITGRRIVTGTGGTQCDLWEGTAALYPWPTAPVELEMVSTSAADVGPASVLVSGLTTTFAEQSASVVLNGLTPVLLPLGATWYRINSVAQLTPTNPITRAANVGRISIRVAGGGAELAVILPDQGKANQWVQTVPAGYKGIRGNLVVRLAPPEGGAPTSRSASFEFCAATPTGAWINSGAIDCLNSTTLVVGWEPNVGRFAAGTDICCRIARVAGAGTTFDCSCASVIIFIRDDQPLYGYFDPPA